MISVALMEPETPGNIGFTARVMKNFDYSNLLLINPKCNHLENEAISRATHARSLLKKAIIISWKDLDSFDYIVGTTSQMGDDYNIPRSPILPAQLAEKLKGKKGKFLVLFGREGNGLTNKEIRRCDFIVTIPASKKYPVMNISHAVSIVLYELFQASRKTKVADHISPITEREKKLILDRVDLIIDEMKFSTIQKRETQKKLWKRILGKAMLTKREAFALLGFLKKIRYDK